MHPILDSLSNTENDWLRSLLFAFNSGDIGKFEALAPHFSKQVNEGNLIYLRSLTLVKPLLQQNSAALGRKICLMSLIEAVFRRSSDNRVIPFSEIAAETRLPIDEVRNI